LKIQQMMNQTQIIKNENSKKTSKKLL